MIGFQVMIIISDMIFIVGESAINPIITRVCNRYHKMIIYGMPSFTYAKSVIRKDEGGLRNWMFQQLQAQAHK